MIGILIGVGAIALGVKGFTAAGLPFSSTKRLTGAGARTVGAICILVGLVFIADGIHSLIPRGL